VRAAVPHVRRHLPPRVDDWHDKRRWVRIPRTRMEKKKEGNARGGSESQEHGGRATDGNR
jgi:hypothetical protein